MAEQFQPAAAQIIQQITRLTPSMQQRDGASCSVTEPITISLAEARSQVWAAPRTLRSTSMPSTWRYPILRGI